MKTSESVEKISAALCKLQENLKAAEKSSKNPAFKSKYADIHETWETARPALAAQGLSVTQFPCGGPDSVGLVTRLVHESGQWFESEWYLPFEKKTNQGAATAITYMRRYAFSAAIGMTSTDEDDDGGHHASRKPPAAPQIIASGPHDLYNDDGHHASRQPPAAPKITAPGPYDLYNPTNPYHRDALIGLLTKNAPDGLAVFDEISKALAGREFRCVADALREVYP